MPSRSEPDDALNASFGAAKPYSQDVRPGFESRKQEQEPTQGDHPLRRRKQETDVPRAPLAQRIREREGE
jgi:hypothetical protein